MLDKSYPHNRYKTNSGKNKKKMFDVLTLMLGFLSLTIDKLTQDKTLWQICFSNLNQFDSTFCYSLD